MLQWILTSLFLLQLEAAESDECLRDVFDDSDNELMILETGYKKPLSLLVLSDKASLQATLRAQVLLKVKPELDQFMEGLALCGVLDFVRRHPMLMACYFTRSPVDLCTGV